MKRIFIVILVIASILTISCTKKSTKVVDMVNRQIAVKENPQAICLVPGLLEWMNKLSLNENVVAIGKDCENIPHRENLPVVGSFFNIDTNAVKSLQPDVILALTTIDKYTLQWLLDNKYSIVLFTYPTKMDDVYKAVELLGNIFDKREVANNLISQYQKEITAIGEKNKNKTARGYFSIRFNDKIGEDMAASGNHIIGNLMELAGITNLAKDKGDMIYHRDDIVKDNPDYVFLDIRDKEAFENKEPYKSLSAVKNNKLIGINKDLLTAYT
ncbi:MAG: ABC transporter substrate-binding protein, partial [Bacteroidota bacterium]|nr:ABC transporter substrate-binding protein [Bacteroidota bacterium]